MSTFCCSFATLVGHETVGLRLLLSGRVDVVSAVGVAALAARLVLGIGRRGCVHLAQCYAQHPEVMQMLEAAATIEQKSQDIETEILQCVESHIKL